jgi:hypothetical protein
MFWPQLIAGRDQTPAVSVVIAQLESKVSTQALLEAVIGASRQGKRTQILAIAAKRIEKL